MDMRRLVALSFGVKFIIVGFFIALFGVHYLFSQALFNRTARLDAVKSELERGADINARSKSTYEKLSGLTPLMQAVSWNDLPRVRLLLSPKYGAGVNLRADNRQGDTALIMAVRVPAYSEKDKQNKIAIINMLLDRAADVNGKNNFGDSPFIATLDVAELELRKKVSKILIAHGADVNTQNNNGNTNLHIAIQRGFAPWVEWFLKNYGSRLNLNLENKDGYTIEELAERLKNIPVKRAVENGLEYLRKKEKEERSRY